MSKVSRGRLTGALLEAVLIVFAVLVALGVDEYMERREERQLAETALERVAAEIHNNREELSQTRESNLALLQDLGEALDRYARDEALGITGVNYELALMGVDAWETARVTRAVHFIDFDEVTRISEVYRIQSLYSDRQDQIVSDIAGIGGRGGGPPTALGSIRGGLAITLQLECDLTAKFDSLLVHLSAAGVASASADQEPLLGCG